MNEYRENKRLLISIHALCEEGDITGSLGYVNDAIFLSTPSARRATSLHCFPSDFRLDFYPRPLRGGRQEVQQKTKTALEISIHALCEEGDVDGRIVHVLVSISIHALCEEGDLRRLVRRTRPHISIHALCEEGDCDTLSRDAFARLFLSTPSARRATPRWAASLFLSTFLSTPSARRATSVEDAAQMKF